MIIDPLTGNIKEATAVSQDSTMLRSPGEQPQQVKAPVDEGSQIIDPMTGVLKSGAEQVSQVNPLAKGEPEKKSGAYDYLYGSLVEVPRDLVWGAVSWPVAQLVRHSAVAGQKIQQNLGIIDKMTPEQQAVMGDNVANWIQTMGGLATPKTETGKASLDLAGKVIEPINKFAHWTAKGINPETHPNLHNVIATGVEFGVFASVPKVGKGLKKIAKDRIVMLKKNGKAKREAAIKIAKDQARLLKDTNDAIAKGELDALITERRQKNQQLIAGAEGFSAIDIPQKPGPRAPTKSDLSAGSKGFEGEVRKPDLGAEPISAAEKVIDPTTGEVRPKITVETVETIPGQRSVYQIITDPLKNERGAIRLPFSQKEFKAKLTTEMRDNLRSIGKAAENAGMEFKDFLKARGMDSKQVREMTKLHKLAKEERPAKASLETVKEVPGDFKTFELNKGDQQVNVGKDANSKIKIGTSDAEAVFSSPAGRKGLTSFFKPAEFMFDRYPKLKPLLHKSREIEATISRELKESSKHLQGLEKQFPRKKLREEAGAAWHNLTGLGQKAMAQMGVKVNEAPKYAELRTELQPLFKDLFDRINEQRIKLGKRPIKETQDYLSFFAKEGLLNDFKNLIKGKAGSAERTNLILDDLATINQRQAIPIQDSTAFHHLKRRGLDKGVELELDPLKIYARYLNESLRHIHMSPLNAFVKELLTKKLTDPKTGKSAKFKDVNETAATEIGSWNNKLAGLPNLPLPRTFERLAQRGMNNLTTAQLFGNARTAVVQSVALFPTAVKHGYVNTAKGITDMALKKSNAPVKESNVLEVAVMDAAVADMGRAIAGSKGEKLGVAAKELAAKPMQWIDYLAREATFRTVWNSLEPLVKKGQMSKQEAIRLADSEVIRTQGSGAVTELSPIQRNVIGKMATLWQTFTINHINFIAKDVLGINNPQAKPAQTAARVMRYLGGMLAINALFEQVGGIQSPMPAPVQSLVRGLEEGEDTAALTLNTLLEVSEAFPFGSSVKFGSSPVGPLIEHAQDITQALSGTTNFNQDMLTKALGGEGVSEQQSIKARIAIGELLGKTLGVPGTAQAAKATRGIRRGESVPRAIFGRIGKGVKKKSGKKSRRRRRKKSRRRR